MNVPSRRREAEPGGEAIPFLVALGVFAVIVLLLIALAIGSHAQPPTSASSAASATPVNVEVITLTEYDRFTFKPRHLEDDEVERLIHLNVMPRIRKGLDAGFNRIQVVAYTDGSPNPDWEAECRDWDRRYSLYLSGQGRLPAPCTNLGVAKLQALFVASLINAQLPLDKISSVYVQALAAGPDQFISDSPGLSGNKRRRKLEIYLLRVD